MVYIDTQYHCHTDNPNRLYREVDTRYFDGNCKTFVEGFCFVPFGESIELPDGNIIRGETRFAWKPYDELDAAQREYERQLLKESQTELFELKSQQEDLLESYVTGVNSI